MKRLYYTVEKELQSIDDNLGNEETTGNKLVSTYSIVSDDNGIRLEHQFNLDLDNSDNSLEEIKGYLEDNGMYDCEYEFIQL